MKTPTQLRTQAVELRKKAVALSNASSRAGEHAPGPYVTGGSGRTRAQNRATERGLTRTIELAVASGKANEKARSLEARANWLEEAPARAARKAQQREHDRTARAAEAALPILNDPAADLHMTWMEWADTSEDSRGFEVRGDHRVRSIYHNGALHQVYLTGTPPKKPKGPFYVVETTADGFPWTEATVSGVRAALHRDPKVANAHIEVLKGYGDFWKHADYRVVPATEEQIRTAFLRGRLPE